MKYSIEPRDSIYVKGYGFLSFIKNIRKNVSSRYGQKLLENIKISETDTLKTASEREARKTKEATDDLIGNKTAHKITGTTSQSTYEAVSKSTTLAETNEISIVVPIGIHTYCQKAKSRLLMNSE